MSTIDKSKLRLWTYDWNSESAKLLADALGVLRIKHENSTFFGNPTFTVINWGSSPKKWGVKGYGYKTLNAPLAVAGVVNKIDFFQSCKNHGTDAPNVPEWTVETKIAKDWLKEGECVIARMQVEGMAGEGIKVLNGTPAEFIDAKLYTRYIPKQEEYRVYLCGDEVVEIARKMKKSEEEPKNWKIRTRDNGFVYVFGDQATGIPTECITEAKKAMQCAGLDFGGVDVVYCNRDKRAYVLEVNSAPWLREDTATKMAAAILKALAA